MIPVVIEHTTLALPVLHCYQLNHTSLYASCLFPLSPPGVVTLTTQALCFHPDIITFRWFCQGGELSPVASQALSAPRPDTQGFFSAMSQCKLPRAELEHGGTKVWVSVHHIALKHPVTRETRGERKVVFVRVKGVLFVILNIVYGKDCNPSFGFIYLSF